MARLQSTRYSKFVQLLSEWIKHNPYITLESYRDFTNQLAFDCNIKDGRLARHMMSTQYNTIFVIDKYSHKYIDIK